MKHVMHLDKKYFDLINENKKNIEIRLLDEKRKKISINDTICFVNKDDHDDTITVKIDSINSYKSFKELFTHSNHKELLWLSTSINSMVDEMHKIYPPSLEEKYGVLKISFRK